MPNFRRTGKSLPRALLAVFLLSVVLSFWAFQTFKTYHFAEVEPGVLYRDGNQGGRPFENALRRAHPNTVVALVDDRELNDPKKPQFAEEAALLKARGIRLERIPIPLGGWPTKEDVEKFLQIVSDPKNQPVIVHCAQGVRRTGMMVAAYEEKVLGYDDAKARAAVMPFGHSDRTVKDVKAFIDGYDPKTGQVPIGLAPSDE